MPWGDWQFWLVTVLALGAAMLLARAMVPRKKARPKRTGLTISAPSHHEKH